MNPTSKFVWGLWLMLAAVPVVPGVAHAADRWQFGSMPSFSSGKYGSDVSTNVVQTPILARRLFTNGDVTLLLPFTCISGSGQVMIVNGTPVQSDRPAASGSSGRTGRAGSASTLPSAPITAPATTCGMGDIVVRGRYYVIDGGGGWRPTIALRAHVKTPTALTNQGLGTGKADAGGGIELTRTIGRASMLMGDGGYTYIGEPDGTDYNNIWWYDVGVGRDLRGDSINLSVFFEEERAILPGSENARDILTVLAIKANGGWRFQVGGLFGLTDGAPAFGLTLGASRRF